MRIAFLCKQKYSGKDVVADRYGRLYEIPRQLSRLGHTVRAYSLDYHEQAEGQYPHEAPPGTLEWHTHSLGRPRAAGIIVYAQRLLEQLRVFSPDLLIGASDIPHAVLSAWLSRKLSVPYAVDLYDNFESFGQARIPGFTCALKWSVRNAGLTIAVSEPLQRFIASKYQPRGRLITMSNGVNTGLFKARDPSQARRRLDLPEDAILIGTAGALSSMKGIATLYKAWKIIRESQPKAHLVLAGPLDPRLPPPADRRTHYLGIIDQDSVAILFNALDVGVITARDSEFGRYCFPQKAYEMVASALPVVAANTGVLSTLLTGTPHLLFPPEEADALAAAIMRQIPDQVRPDIPVPTWVDLISGLEPELRTAAHLEKLPTKL